MGDIDKVRVLSISDFALRLAYLVQTIEGDSSAYNCYDTGYTVEV